MAIFLALPALFLSTCHMCLYLCLYLSPGLCGKSMKEVTGHRALSRECELQWTFSKRLLRNEYNSPHSLHTYSFKSPSPAIPTSPQHFTASHLPSAAGFLPPAAPPPLPTYSKVSAIVRTAKDNSASTSKKQSSHSQDFLLCDVQAFPETQLRLNIETA